MNNKEKENNSSTSIELKNNEILSKYIKELKEDTTLNDFNIKEKSFTCSSIWAKWISYLFLEKENLQRILNAKQKILKKKMESNQPSLLKMKSEDKISENDVNIQKLNELFKRTQDCIDFIERALNLLSSFGFNIKNSLDALKLQLSH